MQKIDMGGFENQEIEVTFAGKTYMVQLDPPVEIYRMFLDLSGMKFDSEENFEKLKNFVATIISVNNPDVDKKEFIKALSKPAAINFIVAYDKILSGGLKKVQTDPPAK
jgi:hypothetical protein